ncbi:MAG TPA: type I DNA topoisomerase [Syntrophothermus lipocalidus]|uniref:type I DNA topoisomerase n=1 Tax=Syntrophothermus lipocalidus TaxID=86170 RepID=UPI0011D0F08C|nr:type I DNA topoisomerase [Syntrophothermus lipocalidus]HHV77121.1 type I DNA topoisomerase [Syntrophothermus lipocalidus]
MGDRVLVIVESAAKAKTISKFLGRNYKVLASVGHVRDLPKSKLGVDVEHGFTPQYVTIRGKGEILKHIREESEKSSRVLLATDPDREGEAIAWHLSQAMNLKDKNPCRIEFNEITKDAVTRAVKKPRPIDMNRVNAQQARRVLDRLVGYSLSPLLWNKIKKGLSAGRVQSVALRLICEREREIESFVPEEYWTIEGEFAAGNKALVARLVARGREKLEIGSREAVDAILAELETARFTVSKVEKKTKKKNPVPPFITSTLQQEAYKKLGFTASRTMRVAQELYEGLSLGEGGTVGLVTYIRTDSSRVAEEAQKEALDFVEQTFGKEYRPEKPNVYKSKKTAQDAHEAIRPTSVWRQPERVKTFLTRDQYRLYKLIWERFLASQMAPAVYDTVTVEITGGGYVFRASASNLKFPGYLAVYQESENEEEDEKRAIPEVQEGQELVARGFKPEQHFTQPPPRYTEASLVKMLEEKNIGRPSTYAPIVDTILRRGYVERKNKQFVPTELGFIVVDLLKDYFPEIMDVEFTASMEENLDRIEEGELNWQETVEEFYVPFSDKLRKASSEIEKVELKPEEAGKDCPVCGKPMVIRNGRYGRFLACSGFPKCRYTESVNEETGITCPQCGRKVIALRTKKGRRFYGCEGYPQCDFRSWNLPTEKKCPQCGGPMVRKRGRGQEYLACTSKECRYEEKEARM